MTFGMKGRLAYTLKCLSEMQDCTNSISNRRYNIRSTENFSLGIGYAAGGNRDCKVWRRDIVILPSWQFTFSKKEERNEKENH